ncbi:ComZ family protein [Pseudalkalibacillus hwajinpoensis]|uniref:ComZ family protein n=1 Tax=Guptibacillus hwajinpoensis TaxID=208199 RepID=UPI001CD26589|nr:ComZ family protein [Pseudalkalibacillus hwajinpoensis]MCA0989956.1 ComZ family protein [Pseudalkalibacillus hwajinpoensis]
MSLLGESELGVNEMDQNMKFMQIAMKYLPEAKQSLGEQDIELDLEKMQPLLQLFLKAMDDAYELGKQDAQE